MNDCLSSEFLFVIFKFIRTGDALPVLGLSPMELQLAGQIVPKERFCRAVVPKEHFLDADWSVCVT